MSSSKIITYVPEILKQLKKHFQRNIDFKSWMEFSYKSVALYIFNRLQQCGLIQYPCIGHFEKALDDYCKCKQLQ